MNLFKNPALILNEQDFDDMIVDGQYDGGVDVLLTDPGSDSSDLIIGQSKFYASINNERIMSALRKKEKTQSALIDAVKANLEV